MKKVINLSKEKKMLYLIICLVFLALFSVALPSLSRLKNRVITENIEWDGNVASSYKKGNGSKEKPYIISTSQEFAYFAEKLKTETYKDTYFELTNNIVLNLGAFGYENGIITYLRNGQSYFVKDNKYYSDETYETEVGTFNLLESLEGFEGHFNGNYYRVYGYYNNAENAALFPNLSGVISNLYLENSLVVGSDEAAGFATNANNASLSNVLFNGVVISKAGTITKAKKVNLSDISYEIGGHTTTVELSSYVPYTATNKTYTLKGNYSLTSGEVTINGQTLQDGTFNLTLSSLGSLEIAVTSEEAGTLSFTDVVLETSYTNATSAGIVSNGTNVNITNAIVKGTITSDYVSGGIAGALNGMNIKNSYSKALVTGDVRNASIVVNIYGTAAFNNVYSTSNNAMFGYLNSADVTITNSFSVSNTNVITRNNATTLNVQNSYVLDASYDPTGLFLTTTIDELTNGEVLKTLYPAFVSFDNLNVEANNVWIFEKDSYPYLFIDDITNEYVSLNINNLKYTNYSTELVNIKVDDYILFNVERLDKVNEYTVYYYVGNSKNLLTEVEVDSLNEWKVFENEVLIEEDGRYTIYVKVVDSSNNVSYLNSDILLLGDSLANTTVNIKVNNKTYSDIKDNLNTYFVNTKQTVDIEAVNDYYDIDSIYYYLSNTPVALEDLSSVEWIAYEDDLVLQNRGKYIVYAKVVDVYGNITYSNTDYIVYDGYVKDIKIGRDSNNYDVINITNTSKVKFEYTYNNGFEVNITGKHRLISSVLLPVGTEITLYDKINNKVYEYNIDSNEDLYGYESSCSTDGCEKYATYEFTLFKEKGKSEESKFVETSYSKEHFVVVLDFSKTTITENMKKINFELEKVNDTTKILALNNYEKELNIYINSSLEQYLEMEIPEAINHNSDSKTTVSIVSGVNYKKDVQEYPIIDSTYEDKMQGIYIKMVDEKGTILDKNYLKNMIFKVDGVSYFPNQDNIIVIPISNSLEKTTKDLVIETYSSSLVLTEGQYYLEISNFMSYDGKNLENVSGKSYKIPVVVSNTNHVLMGYEFKVNMDETGRVLNKENNNLSMNFEIIKSDNLKNPNVRVSLYRKDSLGPYNQDYSIVDLKTYVTNELSLQSTNIYYISNDTANLTLNFNKELENTGYLLMFELYDGDKKIGSISEKFIVR